MSRKTKDVIFLQNVSIDAAYASAAIDLSAYEGFGLQVVYDFKPGANIDAVVGTQISNNGVDWTDADIRAINPVTLPAVTSQFYENYYANINYKYVRFVSRPTSGTGASISIYIQFTEA